MRCGGVQGALAGQEDEQPKRRLEDGPAEEKLAEAGGRVLGDAEAAVEDAEGRDGADANDASADEEIFGDAGPNHGGGGGGEGGESPGRGCSGECSLQPCSMAGVRRSKRGGRARIMAVQAA